MTCYIALLRGINVGGHNKIAMPALKASFEQRGFRNVLTYINSGNVIFESNMDEAALQAACEALIMEDFNLIIPACVLSAADLTMSLAHAPEWWNAAPYERHDAFFVIPPMTAEVLCAYVGATREEYERIRYHGRIIFWSAPLATFSRTRWSKISKDKAKYRTLTVRNANTALKLAELVSARRDEP